jgi:hypothetical protein
MAIRRHPICNGSQCSDVRVRYERAACRNRLCGIDGNWHSGDCVLGDVTVWRQRYPDASFLHRIYPYRNYWIENVALVAHSNSSYRTNH